ncbi:MAG: HmuY family protein [Myxococcota bacterium]|nr:HmuY family protein [Myxococcota bacterium]
MILLTLLACLPDLSESMNTWDTGSLALDDTQATEGPTALKIDATDYTLWVPLDLDTLTLGAPGESLEGWDLRFQRYLVELDGGVSGEGEVEATYIEGADFTALAWEDLPASGWAQDAPDGDDEDTEPDRVFDEWYDYDVDDHSLTPKERVYVVRTPEQTFKLVFDSYYDAAGSPAKLQLRLDEMPPSGDAQ